MLNGIFTIVLVLIILVFLSLERDDLSDDELCEEEEEEEDEDEEEVGGAVVGGARLKGARNTYVCPDSSLKPAARLQLYDNREWRIEVSASPASPFPYMALGA